MTVTDTGRKVLIDRRSESVQRLTDVLGGAIHARRAARTAGRSAAARQARGAAVTATRAHTEGAVGDRYKWVALSNTTLGVLIATIDGSIVIISLPAIFRGIGLDPLAPGTSVICSG